MLQTPELIPNGPSETQIDPDALLQASRRVDWRFLLPDPNLGHVAYLGPARGALVESLRLFSTSLALVDTQVDGPAQYDVVVACDPTFVTLRRAVALLRPQGWLYVEAHSPLSRRGLRRAGGPRFARGYMAALRGLGLDEISAHWHWPSFEMCAEIVPLMEPAALIHSLGRRRSGKGARLKALLGRSLARAGAFALLAPCFSLVGCKID